MKTLQYLKKLRSKFHFYIAVTMLFSIGFNVAVNHPNYNAAFGGVLFQFLASMIIGYVASQFKAKYKKTDWQKIWLGVYVFMVITSILTLVIGIFPTP